MVPIVTVVAAILLHGLSQSGSGGAYVGGDVEVMDGDFVGRDKSIKALDAAMQVGKQRLKPDP